MRYRNLIFTLCVLSSFYSTAYATETVQPTATPQIKTEDHVALALENTQAAIQQGAAGQSESMVKLAKEALKHAKAAKAENFNKSISDAITHLEAAIANGNFNNTAVAMDRLKEAVTNLNTVAK